MQIHFFDKRYDRGVAQCFATIHALLGSNPLPGRSFKIVLFEHAPALWRLPRRAYLRS